jgi:ribose 5-phosphate isomerase B
MLGMEKLKIAIASDHAGFELKKELTGYLVKKGHTVKDFGSYTPDNADYPDYAHVLAEAVAGGDFDYGISLCGSGNGINMTANKHQEIRSALCWNVEIAELARRHNDANVCALPARFISFSEAIAIVDKFLGTSFDGGRHKRRIDKIPLKGRE